MNYRRNKMNQNGKILELIQKSIEDEMVAIDYYQKLSDATEDQVEKTLLTENMQDEQKHLQMFQNIYKMLNGSEFTPENIDFKSVSSSHHDDLVDALFAELEDVEFYRQIYFAFLNLEIRDMIYEIITDEQKHADKLNYIVPHYMA